MITRKIGKILRGDSTPIQIMLATCFGAMIGFMPGLSQAWGMILILLLGLLIFNANLWLTGMIALLGKIISIPLMPVTFALGRVLLDGPTTGLFQKLINAPITALLGLEYYIVTGGLIMGLILGILTGVFLVKAIKSFRHKMATLEEESEAYKKWSSKGSVKMLLWLFMGGGSKKSYDELLNAKGKAIRMIGVIAAALTVALIVIVQMLFADQIVLHYLISGLEKTNGATVDVQNASLDLAQGKMVIDKLAMADPNALETDLLRAEKIQIDISTSDLLRKRIKLDNITVIDASSGEKRALKGILIGKTVEPSQAPDVQDDQTKTIEDYLKSAKQWKQRLSQVRQWLEKVSQPADADTADKKQTLEEKLAQQIQQLGYARVTASHLITDSPTLTITQFTAGKVRVAQLPDQTLDINAANLSTHGHLLDVATTIDVTSSDQSFLFNLTMPNQSATPAKLKFVGKNFDLDRVAKDLKIGDTAPLSGGTFDVSVDGKLTHASGTASIDLPLNVTLHNTTLNIAGKSQKVSTLSLPIGLKGPIDNPAITVDAKALQKAIVDAGASILMDKATDKLKETLGDKAGDQLKEATKGFGKLFGK